MTRPVPDKCEICGQMPAVAGVGFPSFPGTIPGLPWRLLGATLWVCGGRACDLAAQKRAAAAAAAAGILLKTIWRSNAPRPDTMESTQ